MSFVCIKRSFVFWKLRSINIYCLSVLTKNYLLSWKDVTSTTTTTNVNGVEATKSLYIHGIHVKHQRTKNETIDLFFFSFSRHNLRHLPFWPRWFRIVGRYVKEERTHFASSCYCCCRYGLLVLCSMRAMSMLLYVAAPFHILCFFFSSLSVHPWIWVYWMLLLFLSVFLSVSLYRVFAVI